MSQCPCRPDRRYAECCEPWHRGVPAPDAESLMRSRYSAFALELTDYLLATWHPAHRPPALELTPGLTWLGLTIKSVRATGEDTAEVHFVARSRRGGGPAQRHEERSRFRREAGRWYYLEGDLTPTRLR
jgi:SEC-C motif domain protein